jgi:hypothetical protein
MRIFKRAALAATGLGAAVALALAAAPAAGASTAASAVHIPARAMAIVAMPDALHFVGDGTAGWEALSGSGFHSLATEVNGESNGLIDNIGGVGLGGVGDQLCDQNNGFGLQNGLTTNGSTMMVEYQAGILAGAAKNICEGNGVLPAPHVLNANLTGLSTTDHVYLYTSFRNYKVYTWVRKTKHHHGYWKASWAGRAIFQAFDATTGEGPYTASVKTAADWNIDSAGVGAQQDTTLTSVCNNVSGAGPAFSACNELASFNDATLNPSSIFGFDGSPLDVSFNNQIVSSAGGLPANPVFVAPDALVDGAHVSAFNLWVGNAI